MLFAYTKYIHFARNLLLVKWKMSLKGPHIKKGPTELSEIGICLHLSHVIITPASVIRCKRSLAYLTSLLGD